MNKQASTQLYNLKTDVFTNHSPIKIYKRKLQTDNTKKYAQQKNMKKNPINFS